MPTLAPARKLNRNTIKPVLKYCRGQQLGIHAWNVTSTNFYHFTLDTYQGKNSFRGGFSDTLLGCYSLDDKPFDDYAINNNTNEVYDLATGQVVLTV